MQYVREFWRYVRFQGETFFSQFLFGCEREYIPFGGALIPAAIDGDGKYTVRLVPSSASKQKNVFKLQYVQLSTELSVF